MIHDSERKGTEYSLFTDSLSISNSVIGTELQDQQTYIPLSGKIDGSKTRIDFVRI